MIEYYDRQGNPLTMEEWVELLDRRDPDYERVAETTVGRLWVSTVWLGLDHNWSPPGEHHIPLIFETMIFPRWNRSDLYLDRYATEAQALAGHEVAVAWARKRQHGLTKHARDQRRERMKYHVSLLNRRGELHEIEEAVLRMARLGG
jgi:hypothetical protein